MASANAKSTESATAEEWSAEDDEAVAGFINLADVTDDDGSVTGDDDDDEVDGGAGDDDDDDDDDFVPTDDQGEGNDDDDVSSVASGDCVKKVEKIVNKFYSVPGFTKEAIPTLAAKKNWTLLEGEVVLEVAGSVRAAGSPGLPTKHAELSYVRINGQVIIAINFGAGVFGVPSGKETVLRKFEAAVHSSIFSAANGGKVFKRSKESALHSLKRAGDETSGQPERKLSDDFEKAYNACGFMFSTAFARAALNAKPRADRGGAKKPAAPKPEADSVKSPPEVDPAPKDEPPAIAKKKTGKPKLPQRILFPASPSKSKSKPKPKPKRKADALDVPDASTEPSPKPTPKPEAASKKLKPSPKPAVAKPEQKPKPAAAAASPAGTNETRARRIATDFVVEYEGAHFSFPAGASIVMRSSARK